MKLAVELYRGVATNKRKPAAIAIGRTTVAMNSL